jgi:hypothetical protein
MKGIIPQTITCRIVLYLAKILPLSDSEKKKGVVLLNNVFGEIRDRVSMQDVAKFYGLQMNRSGMACCPFHEDGTPSLKIYDDHFYCFGCGETGDCTGFTAKLFGLTQIEAAKKISYDFGLHLFDGEIAVPVNKVMQAENEYKAWLKNATAIVDEYLNKLIEWRKIYAPKNPSESLHPLFVESLKKQGYIEYLSDYLRFGTDKEKRELFNEDRKSISDIRERLDKLAADGRTVKRKAI